MYEWVQPPCVTENESWIDREPCVCVSGVDRHLVNELSKNEFEGL